MSKVCTVCHEEKIASADRKISEFTMHSVNPRTGKVYYSPLCKACACAQAKAHYRPVENKKKPGRASIVERNDRLKCQVEQLLFDGNSMTAVSRMTGVPVYTIKQQKKNGFLVPTDHSSEESETESEESQDNESIAVEAEISDDE